MSNPQDALHGLLLDWAQWMRSEVVGRGYPSQSAGFDTDGRIHCWDDLADAGVSHASAVLDQLIDDMGGRRREAVHNKYLAHVASYRGDPAHILSEALDHLAIGCRRLGLL